MLNKHLVQKQQVSVKALIVRDSKFLCLKDPKNVWELPGGRVEFGESMEDALKRELQEELGFENLKIDQDPFSISTFVWQNDLKAIQFILITYVCSTNEDPKKEDSEWTEFAWFTKEEAENSNLKDGYKYAIRKYSESQNR